MAPTRLTAVREGRLLRGPETLQLNLTNACNLRCVFCWNHSPLRPDAPQGWHSRQLEPGHLASVLDDLPRLRPGHVLLSGRGEPMLHPAIRELLGALQRHSIPATIQTNGTTGPAPEELAALGVGHLLVNISAATAAGYAETHPARRGLHARVVDRLERLAELRRARGGEPPLESGPSAQDVNRAPAPAVSLVAVIQRSNHRELLPLLELAQQVGATALHLKGMEPQPGLEPLQLDRGQRDRVRADLLELERRCPALDIELRGEHLQQLLDHPGRRELRSSRPCGALRDEAPQFTEDLRQGPCYMGWYYLRVTCDGRVMFCCKDKLVDHLDRRSLYQIWRSAAYQLLRTAARDGDAVDGPFDDKCLGCSNFARNRQIHRQLHEG